MSRRHSAAVYRRRRLTLLAMGVTALLAVALLSGHVLTRRSPSRITAQATGVGAAAAPATTSPSTAPTTTTAPSTTTSSTTAPSTTVAPAVPTTVASGSLPQTGTFPTATSPQFSAEMAAFWQAVTSGVPSDGLPAFFPETAYEQVKAVSDPQSDWTTRLLGGYDRDIGAAHQLLGTNAASAQLVDVQVYAGTAHWVTPGTCENRVGYFEVPNSRVVYQVDGQVRSFGIASMIAWRGEWYVVHLGAINEYPGVPMVDAAAVGPGYPAPLSTC